MRRKKRHTGLVEGSLANIAHNFNRCIAVLFPPHPAAVAPSELTGCHDDLPKEMRSWVNRGWGITKQKAARRYNLKNRQL